MTGFSLQKGMVFKLDGVTVRIERILDDGHITLENVGTSKWSQTSQRELLSAYADGRVAVDEENTESTPGRLQRYGRPFADLSPEVQTVALRRKRYVDALIEHGRLAFTPKLLRPFIQRIAESFGDRCPPSPITLYRWYKTLGNTNDPRRLIPRYDARGPRKPSTHDGIVEFFMESLVEVSAHSKAWSVQDVSDRLKEKLDHANHFLGSAGQMKLPCLRTLYRLLDRVDEYDVTVLNEGKAAADRRYRLTRRGAITTRILERVEIDHTPLDLFLIDQATGIPCGRPTLTMLIDVYSRMPLGYYLSFDDTSTLAVMRAIRHAILPKRPAEVVIPELKINHEWPCYGRFECLVADNGAEFHSDSVNAACFDLKIRLLFCPARQPRFKGTIERFLKTCNYSFAHKLPGTSLAKLADRGDYDPLKHAVLTIAEFTQIFEKWLLDVYAQKIHRGTGTTPWKRWRESELSFAPQLPPSAVELAANLGVDAERSLRHDGICLHGLQYVSDALLPIMHAYGEGVRVRVTYDPDDLGVIGVWAPDSQDRIEVRALHIDYASGLRLAEHQLIRKYLRERERNEENPEQLYQARIEIANAMSSQAFDKRLKARRHAMKVTGVSNETPSGARRPVVNPQSKPRAPSTSVPISPSVRRFERRQRPSI
jgi:putative transposase